MGHFTLTKHYDAPIELVFKLGLDVNRMPEYTPWISDIRDIYGSLDKVESRFTFTDTLFGRKVDGTVEVVAVEVPTMYETLTKYENGTTVRWVDRLTKTSTGTDVSSDVDYELSPGILNVVADKVILERIIQRRFTHALENFKDLVELESRQVVTA
jgi:uncharacterized membrane protein